MNHHPAASIIILTWNGRPWIEACLGSVLPQLAPNDELIVVDNGSPDGTAALVAAHFPTVRLLRNEDNQGYAAGNNVGLRAARGALLVLLNQDTVVRPGWLAALKGAMAADDGVGIVGCKVLFPGGARLQHAGGTLRYPDATPTHLGHGEPDAGQWDQAADVPFVTGAAMALRRTLLDQIGLLDEGFFLYYEDTDLCFRARQAGWRVRYEPAAVLEHVESATGERASERYYRRIHQSRWRFILKHFDLADVLTGSVAADHQWLRWCEPEERRGMADAYRALRARLPAILQARAALHGTPPPDNVAATLGMALDALRVRAWQLPEAMRPAPGEEPPPPPPLAAMEAGAALVEQPFRSELPTLGPWIARGREAWNSVATKWYMRPLLDQQSRFNELAVQQLARVERELAVQRAWQAANDGALTALLQEIETLKARIAAQDEAKSSDES